MLLRQELRFLLDDYVVCGFVERILDRTRLLQSYPLPELRLVPERISERIYGHFVAYSADSILNGLEQFYEVAERLVLSLG